MWEFAVLTVSCFLTRSSDEIKHMAEHNLYILSPAGVQMGELRRKLFNDKVLLNLASMQQN